MHELHVAALQSFIAFLGITYTATLSGYIVTCLIR
jgi:hypothetical protein